MGLVTAERTRGRCFQSRLLSIRGHHLHAGLMNGHSTVVDLGAHLGEFSHEISGQFGCMCYAVEAMPSLCAQIEENDLVRKFNYAITDTNSPSKIYVSQNSEANSLRKIGTECTTAVDVEGITLRTFLERTGIASVDLLKVDIEGSEIELFNSMTDEELTAITQITVEFHDFVQDFNYDHQVQSIKKRLSSLGFSQIRFSWSDNTDVLFLNRKKTKLPELEFWYFKHVLRYTRGFSRSLKRLRV